MHSKEKKGNEEEDKEAMLEINNEEKKEEEKEDDIFDNVDVNEKTYLTEIFSILREYIDGAIIVLSIQNFYFEENYVIIAKLRKVIGKEIRNCLIVLNKIDLSDIQKHFEMWFNYLKYDQKQYNYKEIIEKAKVSGKLESTLDIINLG